MLFGVIARSKEKSETDQFVSEKRKSLSTKQNFPRPGSHDGDQPQRISVAMPQLRASIAAGPRVFDTLFLGDVDCARSCIGRKTKTDTSV